MNSVLRIGRNRADKDPHSGVATQAHTCPTDIQQAGAARTEHSESAAAPKAKFCHAAHETDVSLDLMNLGPLACTK
jgi:hypothetical protein